MPVQVNQCQAYMAIPTVLSGVEGSVEGSHQEREKPEGGGELQTID